MRLQVRVWLGRRRRGRVIAVMVTYILTCGVGRVTLARVGHLRWRKRGEGWGRGIGWRCSPSPVLICGKVWHSVSWVVLIKSFTLMDERWAGGRRAWVQGPVTAGAAFWSAATAA
jgi:hypothetical protein